MLVNGREIPDYIDIGAILEFDRKAQEYRNNPNRKFDEKTATIKIVGDSPLSMNWLPKESRLPGIKKPTPCDTCPYRAGK